VLQHRGQDVDRNRHDPCATGKVAELQIDQPHTFALHALERFFERGRATRGCRIHHH
jgi:hypothetical protein